MILVNDVHSRLNATRVGDVVRPETIEQLHDTLVGARHSRTPVAVAGGRHAMGGQQFASGGLLLDTRSLSRVLDFDAARGLVTVEAGIQWPALIQFLRGSQAGRNAQWGIAQKQTGADRLTLGGALSCNAHGRGLTLRPIADQVESFDLTDAACQTRTCCRTSNPRLFRLALGGYGLFGVITRVVLRLRRRAKVRRVVELADTDTLMDGFDDCIRRGFLYGDFQFAIDAAGPGFLKRGVFSCYQPVDDATPPTEAPVRFDAADWAQLALLAHTDKRRAFDFYATRYLETSGQVYWTDDQLSSVYDDDYHAGVDRAIGAAAGSEMITEVYVPRPRFRAFMDAARAELRHRRADVIYGTVRLIERDDETFLAWAREPWACIVLNLHVTHTPAAIARAAGAFRALIDLAIAEGGSYYLTYHRWARRDQLLACYPQLPQFLARKREHDPDELFQSDWYRAVRDLVGRADRLVVRHEPSIPDPR